MSKQKFSITKNIDCTGILDLNEEGIVQRQRQPAEDGDDDRVHDRHARQIAHQRPRQRGADPVHARAAGHSAYTRGHSALPYAR